MKSLYYVNDKSEIKLSFTSTCSEFLVYAHKYKRTDMQIYIRDKVWEEKISL